LGAVQPALGIGGRDLEFLRQRLRSAERSCDKPAITSANPVHCRALRGLEAQRKHGPALSAHRKHILRMDGFVPQLPQITAGWVMVRAHAHVGCGILPGPLLPTLLREAPREPRRVAPRRGSFVGTRTRRQRARRSRARFASKLLACQWPPSAPPRMDFRGRSAVSMGPHKLGMTSSNAFEANIPIG